MQSTGFRACEACRALKIRCEPARETAAGSSALPDTRSTVATVLPPVSERAPCRRCTDYGTPCVYTEPRRTKRKRTDVRVRELEREVRMLSDLLMLRHRATGERESAGRETSDPLATQPLEVPPATATATAAATAEAIAPQQSLLVTLPWSPSALFASPPALCPLQSARDPWTSTSSLESPSRPEPADPVAAGIISMDKAVRLFRRYVVAMAPQRPFVVFPQVSLSSEDEITPDIESAISRVADQVRRHAPVLFLSILSSAVGAGSEATTSWPGDNSNNNDSNREYEVLGAVLDALLQRVYADRIMHQGQKSLELVQALLVSVGWGFCYFDRPCSGGGVPSSNGLDGLRFYQHLHVAATIAIELESIRREGGNEQFGDSLLPDPLAFERAFLACYLCCSGVSLGYHRQAMLSFTPAMTAYLQRLETSPDATPTDCVVVAWVQLQRIVDMAAGALGLRSVFGRARSSTMGTGSGPSAAAYENVPDLSDPGIQLNLQNVTRQLDQWRQDHGHCMSYSLLIQYNTAMCLLHESCFYDEFDAADLKPPYSISIPQANDATTGHSPLTPAHIASRRVCLMAARSLVGLFLSSSTRKLLSSPVVVYTRVGYAVIVLLKLQISAALPSGAMNGLLLETATGESATQTYKYLRSLIVRLGELEARGGRIAAVWLAIVKVIYAWYEAYFIPAANGTTADGQHAGIEPVLKPMKHRGLSLDERSRRATASVPACPVVDEAFAGMPSSLSPFDSMLDWVTPEEEAEFPMGLGTDETGGWMDPRVGLGNIQNQLFEFAGIRLPP